MYFCELKFQEINKLSKLLTSDSQRSFLINQLFDLKNIIELARVKLHEVAYFMKLVTPILIVSTLLSIPLIFEIQSLFYFFVNNGRRSSSSVECVLDAIGHRDVVD